MGTTHFKRSNVEFEKEVNIKNPGKFKLEGAVVKQPAQADSTASDVPGIVADFNALLAKLRAAKLLET